MKVVKARKADARWAASGRRSRKQDTTGPRDTSGLGLIEMITEYRRSEEILTLVIDRQEASAAGYFRGLPATAAAGPGAEAEPDRANPNVAPIRNRDAVFIEDINDAEFDIVAMTAKLAGLETGILAAPPVNRDEALVKIRFMFHMLIAANDQDERVTDRLIDGCLAALA